MDGRFSFKSATIKRTLRGFSKDLSGERMYDLYNAYYGSTTYADDWVTAALDGTGEFVGKPDIVREEAALKGTAYGNVWMYVLHELEVAILDITENGDEESAIKHASIYLWPISSHSPQLSFLTEPLGRERLYRDAFVHSSSFKRFYVVHSRSG